MCILDFINVCQNVNVTIRQRCADNVPPMEMYKGVLSFKSRWIIPECLLERSIANINICENALDITVYEYTDEDLEDMEEDAYEWE